MICPPFVLPFFCVCNKVKGQDWKSILWWRIFYSLFTPNTHTHIQPPVAVAPERTERATKIGPARPLPVPAVIGPDENKQIKRFTTLYNHEV
jgi:hypothetical protein